MICIEVNGGHSPEATMISRELAETIGQPLLPVSALATKLGYRLVAFIMETPSWSGTIWFTSSCRQSILSHLIWYLEYVGDLDKSERRWMYLVNRGLVHPFFTFHNAALACKHPSNFSKHFIKIPRQSLLRRDCSRGSNPVGSSLC